MFTWLTTRLARKTLSPGRRPRPGRPLGRARPKVEALEDRTVLSTFLWNVDASGSWTDPADWKLVLGSYGAGYPNARDDIAQFFTPVTGQRFVGIPDGVTITVGQVQFGESGYRIENLFTHGGLKFDVSSGSASVTLTQYTWDRIAVPVTLSKPLVINGNQNPPGYSLSFDGPIGEAGGSQSVTITGGLEVYYENDATVGYTGLTKVAAGTLDVSTVVPGSLEIGTGMGKANAASVNVYADNLLSPSAAVTVHSDGAFSAVNQSSETIGGLTVDGGSVSLYGGSLSVDGPLSMTGGTIATDTSLANGQLRLFGDVWTHAALAPASIRGHLNLGGPRTFIVAAGGAGIDLDIAATIAGAPGGSLTKTGPGLLRLGGTATLDSTTINAGTLQVDGWLPGTVSLNGGTLTGSGSVGNVTAAGGAVDPGVGPGILTAASAAFNAATTLSIDLNGPAPGNGAGHYDQLVVNGPVNLGGATLAATLGYTPDPAQSFTILRSSGTITGSFAQGTSLTIGGRTFQVVIDNSGTTKTVVLAPPSSSPGPQPGPGPQPAPTPRAIMAQLVMVRAHKRRRLMVRVSYADTGAMKDEFASPYQKPACRNIRVSVQNGQVIVTARKGKRTMTEVYPG